MRMRRPAAEIEPVSRMPSRSSALPGPRSMPGARRMRRRTSEARSFVFMRRPAISDPKRHSRADAALSSTGRPAAMPRSAFFRSIFAALLAIATPLRASAEALLMFAAASLKPALDEIIATPEAKAVCATNACEIKASYAASSQLEHQIEAGAPASLFISADQDWMNAADAKGKIAEETRIDL